VWAEVDERDRLAICEALGGAMSALHAISTDGLDAIAVDWPAWLAERRAGFAAAQAERGAAPEWIDAALAFLDEMWPQVTQSHQPVLLNADITDEHVLLQQEGDRWRMSGLIDFGDAMLGDALYEFTAPVVFFGQRDAALRRALFRGYGYPEAALDSTLSRRLAAMALLHQFADLPLYLRTAGAPEPSNLDELRRALFAFPDA
jgi:hygromycin-B 7''-O-kinase